VEMRLDPSTQETIVKKETMLQMWDHLRQSNGISMRVIAALPADKLDSHPIAGMRTPKELVVHLYDVVIKEMAESVARGELIYDQANEKNIATGIKSRDELLKFARDCWTAADRIVQTITDAQLAAEVKTPWGRNFPGFMMFGITNDEFFHHRGQLFAYLRALGGEPPMMWDFEHNEPAFQPKALAQA
jgi:uncharacterized damage-inducible protein DinB